MRQWRRAQGISASCLGNARGPVQKIMTPWRKNFLLFFFFPALFLIWQRGSYTHPHTHLSILYTYINNCLHVHICHSTQRGPVWLLGGGAAVAAACAACSHPPLFDFRGGKVRRKEDNPQRCLNKPLALPKARAPGVGRRTCGCMCVRALVQ